MKYLLVVLLAFAVPADSRQRDFCAQLGSYYWEVGDRNGPTASGSVTRPGDTPITADTVLDVASSTKWLYAAHVAETKLALDANDLQALRMLSGYTTFGFCGGWQTVASCAAARSNALLAPEAVGKFYYGGGHYQQHAVPTLGAYNNAALGAAVSSTLGLPISFRLPQPAGGASLSSATYAAFLRKLMNGSLRLELGAHPVCTNPSTCPTALNTPIPQTESWHYSLGHWIEDDPITGDGSFSSPGANGYYPWISADKSRYGIVAQDGGSTLASIQCGRQIRGN